MAVGHPNKDVRKAIKEAEKAGWTVKKGKNHRWGTLLCGQGCKLAVASTPRDPGAIAKRIGERVARFPHDLKED
jgi:hypothetical protein